jgi:hypothetical protein
MKDGEHVIAHKTSPGRLVFRTSFRALRAFQGLFLQRLIVEWWFAMHV